MSNKKLIGMPMHSTGDSSMGTGKAYLEYLKQYGTVILLSPDSFVPNLDLLVLPGGKDLINGNPSDFSFYNSDGERFLEWFDFNTLPKYIENRIPVYGICRGFQTICRHFGMPLVQDIWWDHGTSKDTSDTTAHGIHYSPVINQLLGDTKISLPKKIESFHHQGLLSNNVHPDFEVLAVSDEKDPDLQLVEFFIHRELPIIGQQGHPERSFAELPDFLIKRLLKLEV